MFVCLKALEICVGLCIMLSHRHEKETMIITILAEFTLTLFVVYASSLVERFNLDLSTGIPKSGFKSPWFPNEVVR